MTNAVNGVRRTNKSASDDEPPAEMLNTGEAAKALGITARHFQRIRKKLGGVPGQSMVDGAWIFPKASIDAIRDNEEAEDDEREGIEEGMASLVHEVAKMGKEVCTIATSALTAALDCVKGTDSRTSLLMAQIVQQGERLQEAQKQSLEAITLVEHLIVEGAKLEGESIKLAADQSIRVERTKVAASGIRLFAPLLKAGVARVTGFPAIARDAQSDTVFEVFESLRKEPERVGKLAQILDDKQRDAMMTIIGYSEGATKLAGALSTLKSRMTMEQTGQLSELLTQREMTAIASLFEGSEEESPKAELIEAKAS